jgi:hypothetical protein
MIGRSGNREPKHLLDIDAEQNIGNGIQALQPQAGGATVVPQTNPERILMLSGPSSAGQTTSVALTASRIVPGPNNPSPGFPGPITGVIEFGNGGQFTKVEVDIPIGPFAGTLKTAAPATEPQDGGVIITVPTGMLRVYARYDNQFIQPLMGLPIQSLAQVASAAFIGPGGPVAQDPNPAHNIPAEPVQVKAMAAYFSRHTSRVYKTQYLFVGSRSTGIPQTVQPDGFWCIPAFARAVKILRFPTTVPVNVTLWDNMGHQLETIAIPSGPSPIIPVTGTETILGISPSDPLNNQVSLLAACYEIGI